MKLHIIPIYLKFIIHTGLITWCSKNVSKVFAAACRGVFHHREEKNYDADSSKTIDPWEGVLLGGVLASDSFCGGLSLCAMGAEAYIFPFVVGILTYGFLLLADKKVKCTGISHYFAGIALAVIGVVQLAGALR